MLTGTEPRVSATGQCKVVFDRIAGCPKRVELECTTVVVTEDLSRRSILTLRWEMLEGAEREAALAPPPPVSTEKPILPAEKVTKLMEQLKSDDLGTRQNAARELSGGQLDKPTSGILSAMTKLADDPDETVRHAALTILANYGTSEQVPVLIKGLHDSSPGISTTIVHGLARLRDPRAAAPLADFLASAQNDQQYYQTPRPNDVAEALIKLGPASEGPVLALLKEKNIETRVQACLVLNRIGTKRSLGPLKELALYPNKALSGAAAEACQSIQERTDK
jgi:HEAT repeat protein